MVYHISIRFNWMLSIKTLIENIFGKVFQETNINEP